MNTIAVVGLGGHAILPKGEPASIEVQFEHARTAMRQLVNLIRRNWAVVITHGNGPQVGHILIRSEAARGQAYSIPLSVAVAESEGEVGYIIQQALYNELAQNQISKPVVTILTQVLVDPLDQAFDLPTKPIGPFYTYVEAAELLQQGISMTNFPNYGWRRVVASPHPLRIVEGSTIQRLVEQDVVVIAAGGGGIPVFEEQGQLHGIDAVIDKDLASAILAESVGAELLLFLTDVPKAYLNYQQSGQVDLGQITVAQAEAYLGEGHFLAGSMGPKMEAAIHFVKTTGHKTIITNPESLELALNGLEGTHIVP